jgi:hypothetical protein
MQSSCGGLAPGLTSASANGVIDVARTSQAQRGRWRERQNMRLHCYHGAAFRETPIVRRRRAESLDAIIRAFGEGFCTAPILPGENCRALL